MDNRRNIPPPGQRNASDGYALGRHREHPITRAEGGFGRIPPGRAVGHHQNCRHRYADARCRQPAWDIGTSARYIPLTVSTTPSRCRQRAPARGARSRQIGISDALPPRVTHTRTSIYETPDAHNGLISPLCAAPCFLIPSLVCGPEGDGRTTDAPRPPNPCRHRFRLCPRAQPLPRSRGAAVELRLPLVRRPVPCAPCA